MFGSILLSGLLAFFGTLVSVPPLMKVLQARSVVDTPNDRSSHSDVTLRGGGVAMVVPGLVAIVLGFGLTASLGAVTFGLLSLAAVGFRDDISPVSVRARLVVQIIAGALVSLGLLGFTPTGFFGVLIVVSTVNAFNFMDGVNGISGFTLIVSGFAYLGLGSVADDGLLQIIGITAIGVGAGFLPFNFPSARVFLGDAGSYFSGGLLAFGSLTALSAGVNWFSALTPLCLYAFDTAFTLVRRKRRGEAIGVPHREHIYQRVAAFRGHVWATLSASAASAFIVALGVWSTWRTPNLSWSIVLVVTVLAAYALLPRVVGNVVGDSV